MISMISAFTRSLILGRGENLLLYVCFLKCTPLKTNMSLEKTIIFTVGFPLSCIISHHIRLSGVRLIQARNKQPPGMVLKPVVNNGINYQPQLVTAGFLNHQQYDFFNDTFAHGQLRLFDDLGEPIDRFLMVLAKKTWTKTIKNAFLAVFSV